MCQKTPPAYNPPKTCLFQLGHFLESAAGGDGVGQNSSYCTIPYALASPHLSACLYCVDMSVAKQCGNMLPEGKPHPESHQIENFRRVHLIKCIEFVLRNLPARYGVRFDNGGTQIEFAYSWAA